MAKSLSCAETAKLVRQALRESFPGVKFSVRSSTYSMGASITVNWTDGPNATQVESVAGVFAGSYFDGSIDYKGYLRHVMDGEEVSFGADSIHCTRHYSDAAVNRAIDRVMRKYSGNFERDGIARPTVEQYRSGNLRSVQLSGLHYYGGQCVQSEISQVLASASDRLTGNTSNLAARVIHVGNDGYSQVGSIDPNYLNA